MKDGVIFLLINDEVYLNNISTNMFEKASSSHDIIIILEKNLLPFFSKNYINLYPHIKKIELIDRVPESVLNDLTSSQIHTNSIIDISHIVDKHINSYKVEESIGICFDEYDIESFAKVMNNNAISFIDYRKFELFRNKLLMKDYLTQYQIEMPKYVEVNSFDKLTYDSLRVFLNGNFILKPINHAGSLGVQKILTFKQFKEYGENNITPINAEEFIDGELYHIDSIRINKNIEVSIVHENMFPVGDTKSGVLGGSLPLCPNKFPIVTRLRDFNERVINAFDIDGLFHLEVFVTRDNRLKFLEIALRQPGSRVSQSFKLLFGESMTSLSVLLKTKSILKLQTPNYEDINILSFVLPKINKVYKGIILPPLKSHIIIEPFIILGEKMNNASSSGDASVRVLLKGKYADICDDFYTLKKMQALDTLYN